MEQYLVGLCIGLLCGAALTAILMGSWARARHLEGRLYESRLQGDMYVSAHAALGDITDRLERAVTAIPAPANDKPAHHLPWIKGPCSKS